LIYAGEIEGAIHKASKIWASLPGSIAQQNSKALSYALNRFDDGLKA
jgi:muramidase (phage lysozyme)